MGSGKHLSTLSRAQIERLQAARIAEALLAVAAERGYAATTIGAVVERARVSRRSFYDVYSSKDEAFAAAQAVVLERAARRVLRATDRVEAPAERMRAAIVEAVALVRADPGR